MNRFAATTALATALGIWSLPASTANAPGGCHDGWNPPAGHRTEVHDIDSLERAVRLARRGDTIVLADGDYALRRAIDVTVPDVTIRSKSGDSAKVTLRGRGMTVGNVEVAISVSAQKTTVADVTIRDVRFHAIQVRGERGASGFTLHNSRLLDTGQQLLKISAGTNGLYADDGLVACSDFSYTTSAPSGYTNGVDLLATKGWAIRDNRFTRIRGPESGRWASGPTILAWQAAEDTVVERNVIVDSFRGIAFGLTATPGKYARHGTREYDHARGLIRNNVIVNLNAWADEAIEVNAAHDVRIEHNTVLVASRSSPWSISVRFPSGSAIVRNNLTNQAIRRRNGGQIQEDGNVSAATPEWFVDPRGADLHLSAAGAAALGAGVPIPDAAEDFDRTLRGAGRAPDAGAFESRRGRNRGPR